MTTDPLVTMLLTSVEEIGIVIQQTKSQEAVLYLEGSQDALRTLAKTLQQSCPLAVGLFNTPVTVTEV